ncbi:hypothetical protein PGT21_013599 [Puccinia graminis f. sp. tritici]|uniref:Uncharacterized protein n=1 Tax=Puccinia graminis f. sp. tritici TaxID=56615 RepID=A0A5B0QMQ8_PUCGR|nr:hypothetical protein PGT21_013599 [Puccinia graminis f. sp. tritici]
MASRPPHSNRFNYNNNNLNPTASTSSSTLVNELQDEKEKQQRLEYQATAGIHIFEAEGALSTHPLQPPTHLHHPQRKPFQPERDQKLFKTLINSPSKLSRTTAKRRSIGSLNQTTNNLQNHSETAPIMASLKQNQISLSSDQDNNHAPPEDREDQDPDATFNFDLHDGTKRMAALFDSVAHSDMPPNVNQTTKNNISPHLDSSKPTQHHQTEPKPKPRPPLEHLRGRFDKQNQETRRIPSDPPIDNVNRTNGLSTNVTSRSHASSKALSTQRVQAHNQLGHHPTKTSSSQNIAKQPQEPLLSQNTITKDGWRSGPLMTTRESTSDTDDSPEDTFKPPVSSDLNNPTRHSVHNNLPAQKSLGRGPSDAQKKVTFSRRLNDSNDLLTSGSSLDPADLDPARSDSTDPEDAQRQTEPNSSYVNPEEEGQPEQTLQNPRLEAGQTTLNTPKIAGFYPSTPATIRPTAVASRLLANEEASRRLEKLKNQTPRARLKRLPSALQDQPVQTWDAPNQVDYSAMTGNHLQPSTSQASKHTFQAPPLNRNGKGKEKQVEDPPPSSTEPPQTHPTGQVNRIIQESYDQTIITGEHTRASCFPTPHPPGWLVPGSPGEPSSSTGPADRPILHPTSALKHARQKASSRYGSAHDRVIYASNHAVDEPADEVTPRPSKRPAHRTLVAQKSALNKDTQQISTSNPNFTLPSFDGFDHPRQAHLTSTPVVPPLPPHHSKNPNPGPPSTTTTTTTKTTDGGGNGPGKTLKDLAAAVIEFIVDKKPIEVLADTFSMNSNHGNNKVEKKKTIQAKKAELLTQEKSAKELEELMRCSERVEEERRRIQAKLDDLCPPHSLHSRPSRLLSVLKTFFFSNSGQQAPPTRTTVNKREPHVVDHQVPCWIRRHWKVSLLALLFQAACLWMVLHLSTIRSYNLVLQSTLSSTPTSVVVGGAGHPSTTSTTSTSMIVSGSLSYMSRDRLARVLRSHPGAHRLDDPEHGGIYEGVVELARFLADWAAGFPAFLHPFHHPHPHPPSSSSSLLPSLVHPLRSSPLFRFFFPPSSASSSSSFISPVATPFNLSSQAPPGQQDLPLQFATAPDSLDPIQSLLNYQFVPFVPT